MDNAIPRQTLEKACRVLRQSRKSASVRTLATACGLTVPAMKTMLSILEDQPFVAPIRDAKGNFVSYTFTNCAPKLIHMSFCSVVQEGAIVEGSQSPAAPMFDADTQANLRAKYQGIARDKGWVYLDVAHDHMAHLLAVLEAGLKA